MSRREIHVVPVDPEAFGLGMLLGCLFRFWPVLVVLACIVMGIGAGALVLEAGANLFHYGTVDDQTAQQRAASTQVAEANIGLLSEASAAVNDGDYYNAASILKNILNDQPDNQ